jgi:hypothetical protein
MTATTLPNAWAGLAKETSELTPKPPEFLELKDRAQMNFCGVINSCGWMVEWYFAGERKDEKAMVRATYLPSGEQEVYQCIAEDLQEALSMSIRTSGEPCKSPNESAAATFMANRAQPKNANLRFIP